MKRQGRTVRNGDLAEGKPRLFAAQQQLALRLPGAGRGHHPLHVLDLEPDHGRAVEVAFRPTLGARGGRGDEEVVLRDDAVVLDALQCQQSLLENAQTRGCANSVGYL